MRLVLNNLVDKKGAQETQLIEEYDNEIQTLTEELGLLMQDLE
jgi:hypothetical protein